MRMWDSHRAPDYNVNTIIASTNARGINLSYARPCHEFKDVHYIIIQKLVIKT